MPVLMEQLKKNNAGDIPVVIGGVIPPMDIPKLKDMGIKGVFPAGSSIEGIVEFIRNIAAPGAKGVA